MSGDNSAQAYARETGRRLAAARVAARLSQESAATACGVSRSAWAMWEAGRRQMSAFHLLHAARAACVRVSVLAGEDESLSGIVTMPAGDLQRMSAAAEAIVALAGRWE
jgi:transcriptional regulator with XRE-family HTH domain